MKTLKDDLVGIGVLVFVCLCVVVLAYIGVR